MRSFDEVDVPKKILPLLFLLLAAPLTACDGDSASPPSGTAEVSLSKSTYDQVRDDLPRWLEFAAREQVESASLERELSRPVNELQSLDLRHVTVLRSLYAVRQHRPVWVDLVGEQPDGLTEPGETLVSALEDAVHRHGFYPEDVHAKTIETLTNELPSLTQSPFEDVRFAAAELRLVEEWAASNPDAAPEEMARALTAADGPTPRLAEMVTERVDALQSSSRSRVRLDLFLSDALIEYGAQMRWSNPAWYEEMQWPDHLREPASDTRLGWVDLRNARRNMVASRELLPVFEDPAKLAAALDFFVPPFEQYDRLAGAFERYSEFVANGGWSKLPDGVGELKQGDSGDGVRALKRRLRAEGYWEGDEGPDFSESLVEAMLEYQRTHQLWEQGHLSRETRASLNVSAERRLAQIRVALQRWRQSKIGDDDHYVFVNIPDFHAEVWRDGERVMRMKTVVGATTHERDPDSGAFAYVHQTPSLSSTIEHVVLNPYWWVPQGIAEKEIEPEIARDPFYLKTHGYEYAPNDRGEAVLRQRPGPKNALGRVKLNFANEHQVYMHDTPEKTLFRSPARAFSHGCIRLERPMELARHLLEQDGQWDKGAVDKILAAGSEKWLTLTNEVPVHIEYYVVRVDDLGRANFLADLYARDVPLMSAAMKRDQDAAVPVRTVE